MNRHTQAMVSAARRKPTEKLLATHAEGRVFLAEGHLPTMWQEVMDAIETVLRERAVEFPSRYARHAEEVSA
jgi:hypothetical protein